MQTRCPRCGYKLADRHFTKEVREHYPRAFAPWTPEEDRKLVELVQQQSPIPEMAKVLGRQPSALNRRIDVLKIRELAGCLPTSENGPYAGLTAQEPFAKK